LLAGGKLVKSASISKTPGPKQRPTKATHGLPSKAAMSSRGNQRRGPNRNTELSEHGEEVAAWKEVKDKLSGIVDAVNQSSANMAEMHEQDKLCAEKKKKNSKCIVATPLFMSYQSCQ
jgi:hypothetical protein